MKGLLVTLAVVLYFIGAEMGYQDAMNNQKLAFDEKQARIEAEIASNDECNASKQLAHAFKRVCPVNLIGER